MDSGRLYGCLHISGSGGLWRDCCRYDRQARAKGEAVPLGTYQDKKYFWESGEIVQGKTGPTLIIPAFVINRDNVQDPRHWAAVAEKTWGIPYT